MDDNTLCHVSYFIAIQDIANAAQCPHARKDDYATSQTGLSTMSDLIALSFDTSE